MKQLYDLGVRGFWFIDAQFFPAKNILNLKKYFCGLLRVKARSILIGLYTSEQIILMLS